MGKAGGQMSQNPQEPGISQSKIAVFIIAIVVIIALSFGTGYAMARKDYGLIGSAPSMELTQQAWNILYKNYVEPEKLDATLLQEGAIRGMVEALNDAHTEFLAASDAEAFQSDMSGKYNGIGATVQMKDGKIIMTPLAGSPAEKAGVLVGDVVVKINGVTTDNLTLTETVGLVRGEEGTPVTLTVQHPGAETTVDITIIRAQLDLASVNLSFKGDIAVIRINQFTSRTDDELTKVFDNVTASRPAGIILDLRSNPGGLLDTVVNISSRFLEAGQKLAVVRDRNGKETVYNVPKLHTPTSLPMVVIVDEYSASGSEVLTGALQDYKRAVVIGETTFGKGSVNALFTLQDGSGLYVTLARWFTPNGRLIEGSGLDPDEPVDTEGETAINWAIEYLHGKQ